MVDTKRLRSREIDLGLASAARIQDAFLGGSHNFGIEQRFVDEAERALPGVTQVYRETRAFLHRIVNHLLDNGITQFLDIGSGIPTIGHLHEIARRRTQDFRVLYVDNEPLTVAHSRPLLADEPRAQIIEADCREPLSILQAPETREMLDLQRPVALIMSAMLHFVSDNDEPASLVAEFRDGMPPGSYLGLSHATPANAPAEMRVLENLYAGTADSMTSREIEWIDDLFGDFEPVPPGRCFLSDWRPVPGERQQITPFRLLYGGLARKNISVAAPRDTPEA
jgi:hypothetical protein